ncbi:hypothetical protein NQZ68_023544 [Dissostichus eleginoides]|nr:hypothetical protein NQZ68_023544 [Dissostichus eleginoides]
MLELQCDRPPTNKSSHLCSSILDDIPREPLRNTRKRDKEGGEAFRIAYGRDSAGHHFHHHSHKPALIEQQSGHTKDIHKVAYGCDPLHWCRDPSDRQISLMLIAADALQLP